MFIEAPRSAIDAIIEKHAVVRHLIEIEWNYLFQIDPERPIVQARRGGRWTPV